MRRWVVAGVAAAVSLAAAAAALAPTTAPAPDGSGSTPPPTEPEPAGTGRVIRQLTFTGDPAVQGWCWLTVTLADGQPHNLTLRWGVRQKVIWQSSAGPVVYALPKLQAPPLPLVVEVEEGVEVAFAEGPAPPPGASDESRNGWTVVRGS